MMEKLIINNDLEHQVETKIQHIYNTRNPLLPLYSIEWE